MRKYAKIFLAAGAIAAIGACAPSPDGNAAVDRDAIAADIKADVASTVKAFNGRDAEGAVKSNAPDFVQMFHGQANADNAANLANTRSQLEDPALNLTISDETVDVSEAGDMALYSNRYAYDFTDPGSGKVVSESGNWVLVYRRQPDGTMKIYREIISDLPAE